MSEPTAVSTRRLRERAKALRPMLDFTASLLDEAADEIDRLRRYLRQARRLTDRRSGAAGKRRSVKP